MCVFAQTSTNTAQQNHLSIPTNGNSWVINTTDRTSDVISSNGITSWKNPNQIIRSYFYVKKACKLSLALEAKVTQGSSDIKVSFNNESKVINVKNTDFLAIEIGNITITQAGYYYVDLQGISKTAATFANVKSILLGNEADPSNIKFVNQDFYFGRRGPSVHLSYQIPNQTKDLEWYYNEVEVKAGQDIIGSYFMASGFGEGYFGMQVNSSTERRILFSVWSPFSTDDPNSIPEEAKIQLMKKGKNVHIGEFGNEGAGGQSYLVHNWKPGVRYKFLLRGKPNGDNSSTYTAYFFDPELNKWNLIASFKRPQTNKYLTNFHSFLENFIPDQGIIDRKCGFFNQWVADKNNNWLEINSAIFTADETAHSQRRFDYSGGTENDGFYLRNCGFTNELTTIYSLFEKPKTGKVPQIDLSKF